MYHLPVLYNYLSLAPLGSKLALTDSGSSVCLFLTIIVSSLLPALLLFVPLLSLKWKCLLLFCQVWVSLHWTRPHFSRIKQSLWRRNQKEKSTNLNFVSLLQVTCLKKKKLWVTGKKVEIPWIKHKMKKQLLPITKKQEFLQKRFYNDRLTTALCKGKVININICDSCWLSKWIL